MTLVYFDSSALVKLVIGEAGTELAVELWDGCDAALASRLAYPEVRAALAAAVRNHDLDNDKLAAAEDAWEGYWAAVRPVELTPAVERRAGDLAGQHGLRGADAVHLASALAIGVPDLVVAVWDRRLHAGARAAGTFVAPADLGAQPTGLPVRVPRQLAAREVHHEPGPEVVQSRVDLGLPVAAQLRSPRGAGQLSEPMPQVPRAVPWHVSEREQGQPWAAPADDVVEQQAPDAAARLVGSHGDLFQVRMPVKSEDRGEGDRRVSRHYDARAVGDRRLDGGRTGREDDPEFREHRVA